MPHPKSAGISFFGWKKYRKKYMKTKDKGWDYVDGKI